MMGRQKVDQSQLFYLFNLEARIPAHHLLRRTNPLATEILADLREKLEPFYSEMGRPSIDLGVDLLDMAVLLRNPAQRHAPAV